MIYDFFRTKNKEQGTKTDFIYDFGFTIEFLNL